MNETNRRIKFNLSPKIILGIMIVIIVLSILATCFFVVDQSEQAVVLRFGRYSRTVGPGLQFKLPFGIETNINLPTQKVQTLTFGYRSQDNSGSLTRARQYSSESTMLTGDLNIVDVEWIVQYRIRDPKAYLFSVKDKETTIRDISQSIMNQLVGDLPILTVMTNQRTQIEYDAQCEMQKIFDRYDFGLEIVTVKLQNIVPPEGDVQDAFEDVNKAIQDMNRYINEGKQYYNQEIPAAKGQADKIIAEAKGYASERVNKAKGDTARFDAMREEYEKNPDITSTRLYLETMADILSGEGELTIIDSTLDNFLPIKNLGGQKDEK